MPKHIDALHIYPIKSARGLDVTSAFCGNAGLEHDRQYMVVSPETGRFITQRENPRMAQIGIMLTAEGRVSLWHEGQIYDLPDINISNSAKPKPKRYGHFDERGVTGYYAGDGAAAFLTHVLGEPARLIWAGPDFDRSVDPAFADQKHQVGYADGFPYLITTMPSLRALNNRMADLGNETLGMERFRPNIVIEGEGFPPFDEDNWATIEIENADGEPAVFDLVKPCARCPIPGIDQQTGEMRKTANPMKALNAAERVGVIAKTGKPGIFFGMNAVLRSGEGAMLRTGSAMRVVERHNEPLWIPRAKP